MLEHELIRGSEPESRRLMVVLHGLGDSMEGYRWLPVALQLPWMNYLLVNAPDPYYGGYSWYDFAGEAESGIRRSRALLFELLEAQRDQGFPTGQTLLFGFSQGCLLTLEVGLRYPHRLAGLIGISGYVHEPETLLKELSPVAREQRLLVTHGTLDPLIALNVVKPQIQRLRAAGIAITWREFRKEHTLAGDEELAVIREFVTASYIDGIHERKLWL